MRRTASPIGLMLSGMKIPPPRRTRFGGTSWIVPHTPETQIGLIPDDRIRVRNSLSGARTGAGSARAITTRFDRFRPLLGRRSASGGRSKAPPRRPGPRRELQSPLGEQTSLQPSRSLPVRLTRRADSARRNAPAGAPLPMRCRVRAIPAPHGRGAWLPPTVGTLSALQEGEGGTPPVVGF